MTRALGLDRFEGRADIGVTAQGPFCEGPVRGWPLDGTPYHRATPREVAPHEWVFEQPFSLLLNLPWGSFGGDVPDDTSFPQQLCVDYVRVFEAASAS